MSQQADVLDPTPFAFVAIAPNGMVVEAVASAAPNLSAVLLEMAMGGNTIRPMPTQAAYLTLINQQGGASDDA